MFFVALLYLLVASTFTFGKAVLVYIDPLLFIAIRMVAGGSLLLGFLALFRPERFSFAWKDRFLFAGIIVFHIFIAYSTDFWGLQYMTSAKACLLFNLSPFITALYAVTLLKDRLKKIQWLGLVIGFLGMIPIVVVQSPIEDIAGQLSVFSFPEISILISVASSAYGWILMSQLMDRNYSPICINGIGMVGGGLLAFISSLLLEGIPRLYVPATIEPLSQGISAWVTVLAIVAFYTLLLIIIGNIFVDNMYGYLLKRYSVTFLSFAGFSAPFFAALFGFVWLGEVPSWPFFVSAFLTGLGIYIFYSHESAKKGDTQSSR